MVGMIDEPKMARPSGFEPETLALEGRCTIQLCYGRSIEPFDILKWPLLNG